jgi:hypothetical protein
LQNAINLSTILAFTNWDTTIRSVSVVLFESARTVNYPLVGSGEYLEPRRYLEDGIFRGIVAYCTAINARALEREQLSPNSCVAREFDGTVVFQNSVREQSLSDLKGFIWTLYPGQINGSGEKCQYIKEEHWGILNECQSQQPSYPLNLAPELIRPKNLLPTIALRYDIAISGDTIWIQPHVSVNESTMLPIHIRRICSNISRMFVSSSCSHPTGSPLCLHDIPAKDTLWAEGLCLNLYDANNLWSSHRKLSQILFMLQQVDGNSIGQWISCSAAGYNYNESAVLIWQRYSCLKCIIARAKLWKGIGDFVIIADTTSKAPKPEENQESSTFGPSTG